MAPKIKVLDPHCINQIAAGEVVERPLSVVKELIENAIDAGAGKIEITAEGGGEPLIRVRDDGCGISPDDVKLAVVPPATSKISRLDDLNHLRTLGFRGEALPSIAAVAKLSILSRLPEEAVGWEIRVEGAAWFRLRKQAALRALRLRSKTFFLIRLPGANFYGRPIRSSA